VIRRWIGRWLIAVATIHTAFSFIVFHGTFSDIVARGIWNSVGEDPLRGAVAWFFLFGGALLAFGLAVDALERSGSAGAMRPLAWALLVVAILGIILMPVSGFWLVLPAAIGLFIKSQQRTSP
jgi:hypothetical protein